MMLISSEDSFQDRLVHIQSLDDMTSHFVSKYKRKRCTAHVQHAMHPREVEQAKFGLGTILLLA